MNIKLLEGQDQWGNTITFSSVGVNQDTGELATWDSFWGWQTESHNPERDFWEARNKGKEPPLPCDYENKQNEMKRFVLKCEDFENHENPVYILKIDEEGDSFGFSVTEDGLQAQRFSKNEALKWSNEIYDSYCDDFNVVEIK